MLRITSAKATENYIISLMYENGEGGEVDLSTHPRRGVFAKWDDPAFFMQAKVSEHGDTIEWPNGADLAPEFLYAHATGIAPEDAWAAMSAHKEALRAQGSSHINAE